MITIRARSTEQAGLTIEGPAVVLRGKSSVQIFVPAESVEHITQVLSGEKSRVTVEQGDGSVYELGAEGAKPPAKKTPFVDVLLQPRQRLHVRSLPADWRESFFGG